jgi:uncharacterized protein DUF397
MSTVDLSGARWRKSSFSSGGGDTNCVEIVLVEPVAAVRDSKNPAGPVLVLPARALTGLIAGAC